MQRSSSGFMFGTITVSQCEDQLEPLCPGCLCHNTQWFDSSRPPLRKAQSQFMCLLIYTSSQRGNCNSKGAVVRLIRFKTDDVTVVSTDQARFIRMPWSQYVQLWVLLQATACMHGVHDSADRCVHASCGACRPQCRSCEPGVQTLVRHLDNAQVFDI